MRIAEIHLYQVDLPARGGYRMSGGTPSALDSTVVQVVSDTGLSGWGETCPVGPTHAPAHARGARAALTEMAPALIGATVTGPAALRRTLHGLLHGHDYAKAALDIAVHDLLGRAHDLRVCDLLGGAVTDRVDSYHSLTLDDPDETARTAAEKIAEGYPRLQIKVGGRPVEVDIETIRKVWEATRCPRLVVDANRALLTHEVLRIDRGCADVPFVFEQPCHGLDEIAALRDRLVHPVYLDESTEGLGELLRAVALGVGDGFGLKVTRLGGLGPMTTVRDVCEERSLPHTCDDAWGGDVIAAACVHLAATVSPRLLEGVWIAEPFTGVHYDPTNPVRVEGGRIRVPTGPGLGVVPDVGVLGTPVASFG